MRTMNVDSHHWKDEVLRALKSENKEDVPKCVCFGEHVFIGTILEMKIDYGLIC